MVCCEPAPGDGGFAASHSAGCDHCGWAVSPAVGAGIQSMEDATWNFPANRKLSCPREGGHTESRYPIEGREKARWKEGQNEMTWRIPMRMKPAMSVAVLLMLAVAPLLGVTSKKKHHAAVTGTSSAKGHTTAQTAAGKSPTGKTPVGKTTTGKSSAHSTTGRTAAGRAVQSRARARVHYY